MLFDKYWNYTTCIEYDNLDVLESSITEILEQEEGCQRIFELPSLNLDWQEQSRSRYKYLEIRQRKRIKISQIKSSREENVPF